MRVLKSHDKDMGKKGGWFAVFKKAFTSGSKGKPASGLEQKITRDNKKWTFGKQKHGEINLIPLQREPSSVEKILGEAEREQHARIHRVPLKKTQQLKKPGRNQNIPPNNFQLSAVKIQAAYRGYRARRSYRALKAFLRLQRTMRGQSVKSQTGNTMRCMQMLVRVQMQIRTSRLQMIDSRSNLQYHRTLSKSEKDLESSFRKWNPITHRNLDAPQGRWDDSTLAKQEIEAQLQRKVEAVIKRERALAYAYSHQLLKVTPKSAQAMLTDLRSGSFPWWWTWLERQIPSEHQALVPATTSVALHPPATPTRPSGRDVSTRPEYQHHLVVATPRSSVPASPVPKHPSSSYQRRTNSKPDKGGGGGMRDDASLTSCPAFTGRPNYMAATVSAAAKAREQQGGPAWGREKKKKKNRFSFALGQSIGSLLATKETNTAAGAGLSWRTGRGGHRSTRSIGEQSADSSMSLPVGSVGRRYYYN